MLFGLAPLAQLPLVERVTATMVEHAEDELAWLKGTPNLTRKVLDKSARTSGHQLASNNDLCKTLESWLRLGLIPEHARQKVQACIAQLREADRIFQEALALAREMAATAPNPPTFEPRFHPIDILPAFSEQIGNYIAVERLSLIGYSDYAAHPLPPLTQLDLDDWEEKACEGLEIADIYDQQIERWSKASPTAAQAAQLAKAKERNAELRTILNDQIATIATLRTKTLEAVNASLRPEDKVEELARLLGKPPKPKAATH